LSKFEQIIKKLDLNDHINSLKSLFARDKDIILEGDYNIHAKFINALDEFNLPPLPSLIDLDELILKLSKEAVLNLDEIYQFIKLTQFFNRLKALTLPPIWNEFILKIEIPNDILEIFKYFNDEGKLDSTYIAELKEVESALKNIKESKKEALRRVINTRSLQEFLVDSQIHLYYGQEALLVRGGFSKAIKANIIGRSSGGFFYIVPHALENLKEKESNLIDRVQEIYQKYAKIFSSALSKWWRFLQYINKEFDRIDNYQARYNFAKAKDLELILPNKSKEVILKEFKHPAIKDPKPINITFNKKIMLITGVNAGGKTMLLKSILSAVFMSKYLIPFACNKFGTKVGNFSAIEAILDDPQSVKNDISTFAGRVISFRELFKLKDAIVGVDEIELGTDADEAAALFRALLEELSKKELYFIVTTHHKRLASLMATNSDVELIAAIYDEKKQLPTYTYLSGTIGKSYAFETALRYGINEQIINKAKEYLGQDKEQLNKLIEKSTELEILMRKKVTKADEALKRAQQKEQKLQNLKENLLQEQKQKLFELEQKYNSALKAVQKALKIAENPQARRLLNQAYKTKSEVKIKEEKKELTFKEGQKVKYRGSVGVILSQKSKEVMLEIEGLKIRVPKKDLEIIEQKKIPKPKAPKVSVNVQKPSGGKMVLKLLGKRADEAKEELLDFLSQALLHGFDEVEIIHGTGGGVLAKVVSETLKNNPKVKSFERVKGNLGATIVKL
jgi:DNA mismatch repair protein MutS2